jgi:hypothetical protein
VKKNQVRIFLPVLVLGALAMTSRASQDLLSKLGAPQDYVSRRVSSYDRTGGNKDSLTIPPGGAAVLADLQGPGAVHHIWVTIAAEPFYGRKLVLRMFWDGEADPSVEAPIGDFFGVGHGLDRNFVSLPIVCSSEGRGRNCYWYMPFLRSARITVTNEGKEEVPAFYYYVDYRELPALPAGTPYFHARYRQEFPCASGRNYTILEAAGRGHYVGCNLSVLQRAMGWWGEGDDMIYVDGENFPSLHGTGSEDYFSDGWGMREAQAPFYGCPLQEDDFQAGSKATVYRFHIPDPITFRKSIRVTIEHGHANDRSDFYSSTAYWYQAEPHEKYPALPPVEARLPYALVPPDNFVLPAWKAAVGVAVPATTTTGGAAFEDAEKMVRLEAAKLAAALSSYYGPSGARLPVLATDGAGLGASASFVFPVVTADRYDLELYMMKGPAMGDFEAAGLLSGGAPAKLGPAFFKGFAREREFGIFSLKNVKLEPGPSTLILRGTGKDAASRGYDLGLIGYRLQPSDRRFVVDWNLLGPFDAPDMDSLTMVYPPEDALDLAARYKGKNGLEAAWKKVRGGSSGFMALAEMMKPEAQVIVYAAGWIQAPEDMPATILLGSDDGVRVWINNALVHSNPAYRGAYPDQDIVPVRLKKGWNKVLVKILQGDGGWGFYFRFADPDGKLKWSVEPPK